MRPRKYGLIAITALFLAFGFASVFPDSADAKRMGGGSSMGSRGSKSFAAPQQPAQRSSYNQASAPQSPGSPARAGGMFGGMGSGLLGGLGGLVLGGMLGSMLFGGSGAGMGGGGIGLMEIILLGGILWFGYRWFKRQRSMAPAGGSEAGPPLLQGGAITLPNPNVGGSNHLRTGGDQGLPGSFDMGANNRMGMNTEVDEVSKGLDHIVSMDPNFNEEQFLNGAKRAFQQMQASWCDGNVFNLRPLLHASMLERILADMKEKETKKQKDHIEDIQFLGAEISEAWQESGEDWITVRFQVSMLEYATDEHGMVVEGSRTLPERVEEYWTFTRQVGSRDPNWLLAAIQQPGQSLNQQ